MRKIEKVQMVDSEAIRMMTSRLTSEGCWVINQEVTTICRKVWIEESLCFQNSSPLKHTNNAAYRYPCLNSSVNTIKKPKAQYFEKPGNRNWQRISRLDLKHISTNGDVKKCHWYGSQNELLNANQEKLVFENWQLSTIYVQCYRQDACFEFNYERHW